MAENGFGQGVDLGLRMFGAMQNASYMQQLQQNAADENARQQEELQLRQQQFAAQQEQRGLEMDRWVLDHPNEFSIEAKLQATNSMNRRIAGPNARPITQLALDTFDADLRGFPAKLASAPDRQAQLSLMAEMEAKSRENPYFAKAFDLRKPVFEQVMTQQGSLETAKALYGELLDPAQLNRFAKMDPKVITKIFDDKDMNKAFVSRHVQQNLQDLLSGARQFSDAALRDTLAAARSVGFDLGPDGEKILKTHDTYASYNQSAEQLTKIRQTFTPLFDAVKASPDVKNLIDVSGKVQADAFAGAAATGKSPFGGLAYAKAHLDAADRRNAAYDGFLQNNPAVAQQLQELTPQAISRTTQIDRQVQDLERQRELVEKDKLRPNRDMLLNLYDRQMLELRREATVWKPFVEYARTPNIESLAHVLQSGKTLDRSLKEVSTLRDTALTASDRQAQDTAKREWLKANTSKATHDATAQLFQKISQNPNSTDEQRLGWAAEIGQNVKKTYGVMPDMDEVAKRVVAQRTKTEDTLMKLTPEQGFKFETAVTGLENTKAIVEELMPNGKLDRQKLTTMIAGGLPFTGGRTIQAYVKDALDAEYRARTGAAMPESEWERAQATFVPGQLDDEQTAKTKLQNLQRHFENKLNLVDPEGKLRGRVKPVTQIGGKPPVPAKILKPGAVDEFDKFAKAHPDMSLEQAWEEWIR